MSFGTLSQIWVNITAHSIICTNRFVAHEQHRRSEYPQLTLITGWISSSGSPKLFWKSGGVEESTYFSPNSKLLGDEERIAPSDAMGVLRDTEWETDARYDDQDTPCWKSLPLEG
ncbi:PREDICTED: uncharacterized protein LOC101308754 [Fragaria vesca subsp. vesca]